MQKVDYSYNIRGWLKGINDVANLADTTPDLFSFQIRYHNSDFGSNNLYNGNISETYWRTSNDNVLRKYVYLYDQLNRLNYSYYQKPELGVTQGNYDEYIGYDKNGNIQWLNRNGELDSDGMLGWNRIDNLNYTYHPTKKNQLMKVIDDTNNPSGFKDDSLGTAASDTTDDYDYDANGNMIKDENKGITSITYNHLNLPVQIVFGNNGTIDYLYDATGKKVNKTVYFAVVLAGQPQKVITDYMQGGFQYKDNALQFFPHAEGYVTNALVNTSCPTCRFSSVYSLEYVFSYTDHLGNVRLNYAKDPSTGALKVLEENHYYPFGLKHQGCSTNVRAVVKTESNTSKIADVTTSVNYGIRNYKYNGKELQDELGLNTYAYGWREYDPAIGRFNRLDRFSEKYPNYSPYNYAKNNPIRYREMAGDSIWVTSNTNKRGITNFTIHFTGKVYNTSDTDVDVKAYAKDLKNRMTKAFTGKSGSFTYSADVNITGVSSLSDVKKSDHLLAIVDDVEFTDDKGGPAGGIGTFGGQIAYVKASSNKTWMAETGIHEWGHNFGLEHNWKDGFTDTKSSTNYMSYSNFRTGSFSVQQLQSIISGANSGSLNQGNPTQGAPSTTNNWFYNNSTTTQPYDFNVKRGDIIPTIIQGN